MPEHRSRLCLVVGAALALVLTGCAAEDPEAASGPKPSPSASASAGATAAATASASAGAAPSATPPPRPKPRFGAAKRGQCHRMTAAQSRFPITVRRPVSCDQRHTTTVVHVGLVRRAVTTRTPLAKRRALARKVCEPAFRRAVGGTPALRAASLLTWTFFVPSRVQLQRGARWVRCDALARSGGQLVPLPPGRPLLRDGLPEQLRICQTPAGSDVSCARPHAFRVAGVFRPPGNTYPGPDYTTQARDRCEALIGVPGGYWQPPSPQGWARGDRFVRCLTRAS